MRTTTTLAPSRHLGTLRGTWQRLSMSLLVMILTTTTAWANGFNVISGTAGVGNQNCENLFDNNTSTKWCVTTPGNPTYVEFSSTNSITPKGYVLTTGNDTFDYPGRNPMSWTIKARATQDDPWTVLTTVTNDEKLPAQNRIECSYYFPNTTAYQYFRFEITQFKEGSEMQLSEFQFLTSADSKDLSTATVVGVEPHYFFNGSTVNIGNYSLKDVDNQIISTSNYNVIVKNGKGQVVSSSITEPDYYTLTFTAKNSSGYKGELNYSVKVVPWKGIGGFCGSAGDGRNLFYEIENINDNGTLIIHKNPFVPANSDFGMSNYEGDIQDEGCIFAPWIRKTPSYEYEDGSIQEFNWYNFYYEFNNVVIEDGVGSIGENAFYYCNSGNILRSLVLPASVTVIGSQAFLDCWNLNTVTIPASN